MKNKNIEIKSIVVTVIAAMLLLLVDSCISSILLFVVLGAILFMIDQRQLLLYSIGTIIVIAYLVICKELYGSFYFGGNIESDDFQYEMNSFELYRICGLDWTRIYDVLPVAHNSVGYVYFLAVLHGWGSLFDGYSHFLPFISNIFSLNLASIFLYKISRYYNVPDKISKTGTTIFCLYPSLLQLTAYTFRDIIVGLLVIIAFYNLLRPLSLRKYIIVAVCLLFLFFLRMQVTLMLGILVVLFLFNPSKLSLRSTIVLFGGAILMLYVVQEGEILEKMEHYTEFREETSGSILSKMMRLPIYFGIFPRISILSVTPMLVPRFDQVFAGLSGLSQFLTFPIVLIALLNNRVDLKLKITYLLFFVGVALSTFTFRHISMFLPFAFLLCMSMYKEGFRQNTYLKFMVVYVLFWMISFSLIFV